ncbi:MAG TPA: HAMP domain-containing histidine kinase [Candidatus Blautia faecavium]|uniref:histidine kinase n=1 Tax=Candidatus Blautia faecavium TaxID=2838487 RepID=A0A9D2RVB6_9FIRM|nr:HAMP domain-containing histidine kinase [Candidatus Blautia faecavium]
MEFIVGAVFASIIWAAAACLYYRKREKKLDDLIMYLMKVQDGQEFPSLSQESSGRFGILKSEIYKMVVLLKEQSQGAQKERGYLAQMLSDISHQIKTPLAAITLMTDLLKNPKTEEKKREEFIKNIDTQVNKITWLIRNLLTLSQLEADVLQLKKERTEVRSLLEKACQPFLIPAEMKEITLTVNGEENLFFLCDREWTTEAFSNIIKNCIEHTGRGGFVKITAAQNNFATTVTIEDNGAGIAKEDLPHIFERFYKGRHGSKESVGIGLAMAKQIVMQQNGVIRVESEEGRGSIFKVKMYI